MLKTAGYDKVEKEAQAAAAVNFTYKEGCKVKIKKDSFFRSREKVAEMWDIKCLNCNAKVLLYQKDGRGRLHRCYLNRIFDPDSYSSLQDTVQSKKEMPLLKCQSCNETIGYPTLHWEGRLAFLLVHGKWYYEKSKIKGI